MAMTKKQFMKLSQKEMDKLTNDELMELLLKFKIMDARDLDSTKMKKVGMGKKIKMAHGGVTGMSGAMEENTKNRSTDMTTMK